MRLSKGSFLIGVTDENAGLVETNLAGSAPHSERGND